MYRPSESESDPLYNSTLHIRLDVSSTHPPRDDSRSTMPASFEQGFPPASLVLRNKPHVELPTLIYGIAFKREATADLVYKALQEGYRGVDSANWPRTYDEPRAGEGVRRAVLDGIVKREDLFIQSKFTPWDDTGKEYAPYNPDQPVEDQVRESIQMTMDHFAIPGAGETYLDSVVLHVPYSDPAKTLAAYRELCAMVPHRIRQVGVSNFSADQLARLEADCAADESGGGGGGLLLPPAVVQNRFNYVNSAPARDAAVRKFCREHGIIYQPFGVFEANPDLCAEGGAAARVVELVAKGGHGKVSVAGALAVLVMGLGGVAVLDGSSSESHMRWNLALRETVRRWAEGSDEGKREWDECVRLLREQIGDPEKK